MLNQHTGKKAGTSETLIKRIESEGNERNDPLNLNSRHVANSTVCICIVCAQNTQRRVKHFRKITSVKCVYGIWHLCIWKLLPPNVDRAHQCANRQKRFYVTHQISITLISNNCLYALTEHKKAHESIFKTHLERRATDLLLYIYAWFDCRLLCVRVDSLLDAFGTIMEFVFFVGLFCDFAMKTPMKRTRTSNNIGNWWTTFLRTICQR